MKKVLKILGISLVLLIIAAVLWIIRNMKDHNPGYRADLEIRNDTQGPIKVGFAAEVITPDVPDRWTDVDGNAEYEPEKGDTFTDGNGNGQFDPVWMAGFGHKRAANGVNDDLWARSIVIDDGKTRLGIVVLDAIGLMSDDILDIRKRLPPEAGVTYTIVASTHSHEAPDLLGLWGENVLSSGIKTGYMEYVKDQAAKSVALAVKNMRPARLEISEDMTGAINLVKDTREPQAFDSGLRLIRAIDKENGITLGTLLAWADHAETLWSDNLMITSDFPHYFREGVEKGVYRGDSLVVKGTGGVAVYINGAIGGLMTTHPSLVVTDPFTSQLLKEPSFEKAHAQGNSLALLALSAMSQPEMIIDSACISLIVRTITLPIDNTLFKIGTATGILDRGSTGWMKMRSELSVFNLGPLSFATLPGEVYPEIINGVVEAPDGRDFEIDPVEVPPVREMMQGRFRFIFCLANDEIGYVIPKSQWDAKAPYTYGRKDSPYGEENSLGPETGPIIHRNIKEMLNELNKTDN